MDTSVVALHVATGDTKVTEAVPVYSYSSPFCQPHSLTLALYISLLQKVIKLTRSLKIKVQYSQACGVKAITEWDEAEWWIFDFAGSLWGPSKRWAEVTAANHQSKFALIVFICLLPYSGSLTAGVTVEHLQPSSFSGQSVLPLPGPLGLPRNVCSGDAWVTMISGSLFEHTAFCKKKTATKSSCGEQRWISKKCCLCSTFHKKLAFTQN